MEDRDHREFMAWSIAWMNSPDVARRMDANDPTLSDEYDDAWRAFWASKQPRTPAEYCPSEMRKDVDALRILSEQDVVASGSGRQALDPVRPWEALAPMALPIPGPFQWPGRDRLSIRDRVLLESRSMNDLVAALGAQEGELDQLTGFFEYLVEDWKWLHEPSYRERHPEDFSRHKYMLRESEAYRKAVAWTEPVPAHTRVLDIGRAWRA